MDIENEVGCVVTAVQQGKFRQATNRESMTVRLAALSEIVNEMRYRVENDKELVEA